MLLVIWIVDLIPVEEEEEKVDTIRTAEIVKMSKILVFILAP